MKVSSVISILIFLYCSNLAASLQMSGLTTSGLSSGGYMAAQLHVAFSSSVNGSAIFAGGPYYCSQGSLNIALTQCMGFSMSNVDQLVSLTKGFESKGYIDSLSNLDNSTVFLYSGTGDTVVKQAVVKNLEEMYTKLSSTVQMNTEYSIDSEHCLPTLDYGNTCTFLGTPYINKCNYDGAGIALSTLLPGLKPAVTPISDNIVTLKQLDFLPSGGSSRGLDSKAYAYVPTACQEGQNQTTSCHVHIAWHGCQQGAKYIGNDFYEEGGYNSWAEANNIIVVYPQAVKVLLKNPEGCWDWWGYAGSDFAFKTSSQMRTALNMARSFFQ